MKNSQLSYRDTWAEINLNHIQHNVEQFRQLLPSATEIMAVVKANAYGHGDRQVAEAALSAGATSLAVAFLDEAIRLRQAGIKVPILVLGSTRAQDARVAVQYDISLNVHDIDWIGKAIAYLQEEKIKKPLNIHVKVDTGMGRLGIRNIREMKEIEYMLKNQDYIHLEGVFTHFSSADELDLGKTHNQLLKFREILDNMEYLPPFIHTSNSAAAMRYPDAYFNTVRLGISMYGLSPSPEISDNLPVSLKPALSLYTKIKQIKKISPGDTVGYGATYKAIEPEWIATLPIGYADGWIRKLSGQSVLVKGHRAPIVGRICMDQCMVKLDQAVPEDTVVTLIGNDGDETITVDEIAGKLETINYEVICQLSSRVPRVYKQDDLIVETVNQLFHY